jgi:hypothetical protein
MKLFILTSSTLNEALGKLAKAEIPQVSAKTLFKFQKIFKGVETQMKDYEEIRMKVLKKFADLDENGEIKKGTDANGNETMTVSPEKIADFNREMIELSGSEVEVTKVVLDIEELNNISSLSARDISILVDAGLIKDE